MWFISVWRPENEKNKLFAFACSSVSKADRIITAITLFGIPNNVLLFGKGKNGVTSHPLVPSHLKSSRRWKASYPPGWEFCD